MSESWLYINGKKYKSPVSSSEAKRLGWHHGVNFSKENAQLEMLRWCRENFDPHVYTIILWDIWFINSEDAMLCNLRWA